MVSNQDPCNKSALSTDVEGDAIVSFLDILLSWYRRIDPLIVTVLQAFSSSLISDKSTQTSCLTTWETTLSRSCKYLALPSLQNVWRCVMPFRKGRYKSLPSLRSILTCSGQLKMLKKFLNQSQSPRDCGAIQLPSDWVKTIGESCTKSSCN